MKQLQKEVHYKGDGLDLRRGRRGRWKKKGNNGDIPDEMKHLQEWLVC